MPVVQQIRGRFVVVSVIVVVATVFWQAPATTYDHDRSAGTTEDMRLVCAFNQTVTGRETHDADGSYALVDAD